MVIDLWVLDEISKLKRQIVKCEELINRFYLELNEINGIPKIRDYATLIQKYENPKINKFIIDGCRKRIVLLKDGAFKNKEEYCRTGIY